MITLTLLKEQLADRQRRTTTMVVPSASLRLGPDGRLETEGHAFDLAPEACTELGRRASVPGEFFRRCSAHLRAALFNELYPGIVSRCPDQLTSLVVRGDTTVIGLADPRLVLLSSHEVLTAALQARPEELGESQLEVAQFHLNGGLRLSIISPQLQTEPRVGDVVKAGIDIAHDDAGARATQINSFLLRLACTNGMLTRICCQDSTNQARIRRAAAGNVGLTRERIHDKARNAWAQLQVTMAAIQDLAHEPADNAAAIIRAIGEKLRLGDRMIEDVIRAVTEDELGPSGTLWDVVNAFSRVGTHSLRLTPLTGRYFQELGGDLIRERIERCPSCGALRHGRLRYLPRR